MVSENEYGNWSIDDLQEAWHVATKMHDGQKYGGAETEEQIEYLNHIGSVAFEVLAATAIDRNLNAGLAIKCAMLHDTLEDTALAFADLEKQFGVDVANGVMALTKDSNIPDKRAKMLDSLKRIKQQPKEIWAVKMADRICNLNAPPFYWDNGKKQEYLNEAWLIHGELQEGCKYLADRLAAKIKDYKKFIH
jgi:(p)ppGpp synthase/HD superfamily hydrolase